PTPESSASLLTVLPLTAAAGVRHVCAQFVRLRVLVLVTVLLRYGGEIGFVLAAGGERDRPGRANQRQMGERLRHVTHLPLLVSVVLLREQPDVVAEPDQAIHQRLGIRQPSAQRILLGKPEGTGEERMLAWG